MCAGVHVSKISLIVTHIRLKQKKKKDKKNLLTIKREARVWKQTFAVYVTYCLVIITPMTTSCVIKRLSCDLYENTSN